MAYDQKNLKPWVIAAENEIGSKFGIKTAYGWRKSDPFPDHPSGLAVDFMISDLSNGSSTGSAMADYVIANAKRLGVKYIIWNRRSWNPQRNSWANYTGSNPHTDHVHVTFNNTAPAGGSVVDTPGGGIAIQVANKLNPLDQVGDALKDLVAPIATMAKLPEQLMKFFLPSNFVRISAGIAGTIFIIIGITYLVREVK